MYTNLKIIFTFNGRVLLSQGDACGAIDRTYTSHLSPKSISIWSCTSPWTTCTPSSSRIVVGSSPNSSNILWIIMRASMFWYISFSPRPFILHKWGKRPLSWPKACSTNIHNCESFLLNSLRQRALAGSSVKSWSLNGRIENFVSG